MTNRDSRSPNARANTNQNRGGDALANARGPQTNRNTNRSAQKPNTAKTNNNDPVDKAKKSLKTARSQYGGALRNVQDLESTLSRANLADRITGNTSRWERELAAERARAKALRESLAKQAKQVKEAEAARDKAKAIQEKAAKAKTESEKKRLNIEAEKQRDIAKHASQKSRQIKIDGTKSSGQKYLSDMKRASGREDKKPEHEKTQEKHKDIKDDVKLAREVDARNAKKPTGTQSQRLSQALDKQKKETDKTLRFGGGISSNVTDAGISVQNSSLLDRMSGMHSAKNQELDNDQKLLANNNKEAEKQLKLEKKLQDAANKAAGYEADALKYQKLGDNAEAQRLRSLAKKTADLALAEFEAGKKDKSQSQRQAVGSYLKDQQKVNQQYEVVADRMDKAATTMKVTRDAGVVIVAAGATVVSGGTLSPLAAVAVGTVAGGTTGVVSNYAGAASSITTGYQTKDQALAEAGRQSIEDFKTSAFTAGGTILGMGAASKVAPALTSKLAPTGARMLMGSTQAGVASFTTSTLQTGDRVVKTKIEFEQAKKRGEVADKDQAKFFADRGLTVEAVAKDLALNTTSALLSGGVGARADVLKELKPTVWGKVGAVALDTTGSVAVGVSTAYVRNGGNVTFEDIANESVNTVSGIAQGHFASYNFRRQNTSGNTVEVGAYVHQAVPNQDVRFAAFRSEPSAQTGTTLNPKPKPDPFTLTDLVSRQIKLRPTQQERNASVLVTPANNATGGFIDTSVGRISIGAIDNSPTAPHSQLIVLPTKSDNGSLFPTDIAYQGFVGLYRPTTGVNGIPLQKTTIVGTPEQLSILRELLKTEVATTKTEAYMTAGSANDVDAYYSFVPLDKKGRAFVELKDSVNKVKQQEVDASTRAERFLIKTNPDNTVEVYSRTRALESNLEPMREVYFARQHQTRTLFEVVNDSISQLDNRKQSGEIIFRPEPNKPQVLMVGSAGLIAPEANTNIIFSNGKTGDNGYVLQIDNGNSVNHGTQTGVDWRTIDVNLLTHFHADHSRGMMEQIAYRATIGKKTTLITTDQSAKLMQHQFEAVYGKEVAEKIWKSIDRIPLVPKADGFGFETINFKGDQIDLGRTRHNFTDDNGVSQSLDARIITSYLENGVEKKVSFSTTGDTQFGVRYLHKFAEDLTNSRARITQGNVTQSDIFPVLDQMKFYSSNDEKLQIEALKKDIQDQSGTASASQKSTVLKMIDAHLTEVERHIKLGSDMDEAMVARMRRSSDVHRHTLYFDAGAAKFASIPAATINGISGNAGAIHPSRADAEHFARIVSDPETSVIAGHVASDAQLNGARIVGSSGAGELLDLRSQNRTTLINDPYQVKQSILGSQQAIGLSSDSIRVSRGGAVYFKSKQDLQNHYRALLDDQSITSGTHSLADLVQGYAEQTSGVEAFYDAHTRRIYAVDLNASKASIETRLLHGSILAHEARHRSTMDEVEAFSAMYDYVKRYNEHASTRGKPQYQLNISQGSATVTKVEAGKSVQYPDEIQITEFVKTFYPERRQDERIAAIDLSNSQKLARDHWRAEFKQALEYANEISDTSVRDRVKRFIIKNDDSAVKEILNEYVSKAPEDEIESLLTISDSVGLAALWYNRTDGMGNPIIPDTQKLPMISDIEFERLHNIGVQILKFTPEQMGGLGAKVGKFYNPVWGATESSGKVIHGMRLDPAHDGGIDDHGIGGDRPHIDVTWNETLIRKRSSQGPQASYKVFIDDSGNTVIRSQHPEAEEDKKLTKNREKDKMWVIPAQTEVQITVDPKNGMITVNKLNGGVIAPTTI